MEAKQKQTVKDFYKTLVGQTLTVHIANGQAIVGTVLDVDAGDILLRRSGENDLALIPAEAVNAIVRPDSTT